MISSEEALRAPKAQLNEREMGVFQNAESVIDDAIRANFDGQPIDFPIAIEEVPARVIWALKRRFEQPAPDGSRWHVTVGALIKDGVLVGHKVTFEPAAAIAIKQDKREVRPRAFVTQLMEELADLHGRSVGETGYKLSPKPALSVLFGTYNRIDLLRSVVESIRKSASGLSYEIVVCDGGSTDGSRQWLAGQGDVVLVAERHLEGAVKAFNQCYAMCRGEFIANLNDDCVVEGDALRRGVEYLQNHADAGQVAFAFNKIEGDVGVNQVYPRAQHPHVTWPTEYANFGVARRQAVEQVVAIQGGFWNPCYRTYGADVEFSAWLHKLGWKVVPLPGSKISDTRIADDLRAKNVGGSGIEAKRMGMRWPAEAFRVDGPDPRVSPEELERFRRVKQGRGVAVVARSTELFPDTNVPDDATSIAELVGWPEAKEEGRLRKIAPLVRALDPVVGRFPRRAEALGVERVLHVSLVTKADPQAGLVRALRGLGGGGYAQVDWLDFPYEERQRRIVTAAAELRPTLVFMQLQAPNAVAVETVRKIREVSPGVIIATWCGDIASDNSPWGRDGQSNLDWQVPLGRACDLTLHSSMAHVHALRAAGIHTAGYLQIGYDEQQYSPIGATDFEFDVCFLGSRYGGTDAFSRSMRRHDGELRDAAVLAMQKAFGERFGLFGSGWDNGGQKVALEWSHEVYWKSRIGLCVSLANDYECYTSDRLHRILGCGALLLVKAFPGMSTYGLKHWANCLVWETPEEAVSLAKTAVSYWEETTDFAASSREVAAAGARLAREHHTWDVRVRELQCYFDAVRSAR